MHQNSASDDRVRVRILSRRQLRALVFAIVIAGAGLLWTNALAASRGEVTHVVIMWLKRPGNDQDRAALGAASESFRNIPGVLRVDVGRPIEIRRPGIEQSFDLSVVFTFRDRRALRAFEKDPRHLAAIRKTLTPLVRRFIVFNSVAE